MELEKIIEEEKQRKIITNLFDRFPETMDYQPEEQKILVSKNYTKEQTGVIIRGIKLVRKKCFTFDELKQIVETDKDAEGMKELIIAYQLKQFNESRRKLCETI